jgi:hypothetical protein
VSETGIQIQKLDTVNRFRTENDSYINTKTFEINEWSPDEKILFNNCRLYLRVEILSDIMTANGSMIRKEMITGDISSLTERFVPHLIRINKPSQKAWKIWKKMLMRTYNANDQGLLLQHMAPIAITTQWDWFLHASSDRIYRKYEDNWKIYSRVLQRSRTRGKHYEETGTMIGSDHTLALVPITVY